MQSIYNIRIKNSDQKITLRELPSLRLTFLFASMFLLLAVLGTLFIHVYFLALVALVSLGLMVAAVAGVCPMTAVFERLAQD